MQRDNLLFEDVISQKETAPDADPFYRKRGAEKTAIRPSPLASAT